MVLVTSAFAIISPLSANAGRCGGTIYLGDDVPYGERQPYACSIGHYDCTVQPILFTTIGSSTEKYHFHAAYHSSNGETYYYCTY